MKQILEALSKVVELVVPYLEALGTETTESGEWPANAIIAWSPRGSGIQSLAAYVAQNLEVTEEFAEQLIVSAAIANPDRFRLSYMRNKKTGDGHATLRERDGMPVATISLKAGRANLKPFVPGQTVFAKKVNDATVVG